MVIHSRPWRSYAKAVLINCNLEKNIMQEGWHDWGNPQNRKTAFYAEYNSTGPGANDRCRVRWSKRLKSIKGYEIGKVLEGWDPLEK